MYATLSSIYLHSSFIYYLLFIYYFGPFLLVAVFFSFFPFYFYFTFETRYGRYQSARARNRLPRVKLFPYRIFITTAFLLPYRKKKKIL